MDACLKAVDRWAWIEDTTGEARAWEELALAALEAGRPADAVAAIERSGALRETNGPWADPPYAELRRGTVLHELGRLEASGLVLRAGRRRALESGLPLTTYDGALGWLLAEEVGGDEGLALLTEAERTWRAAGHALNLGVVRAHRTLALAAAGRWDEAADEWSRAATPPPAAPPGHRVEHAVHALVAIRTGRDPEPALARWRTAAPAREVALRQLGALVEALAAGRDLPSEPATPSSLLRVARRVFGPAAAPDPG